MRYTIGFILFIFISYPTTTKGQSERLNVFINCECDVDYVRQHMTYVNFVRDQVQADVQVFVNQMGNGSGGKNYVLDFVGRADFESLKRKLHYETTPTMTNDEERSGLTQKIAAGILYFLMDTEDWADRIKISIVSEKQQREQVPAIDPWGNWIFELYGQGELEKESNESTIKYELGFNADRVTEEWRIRADFELNYLENIVKNDDERLISTRERYRGRGSVVKSLGQHWSAGLFLEVDHNTFRNIELSNTVRAALEFNIFPYSEVVYREITFAYYLGHVQNKYIEKTIYDRVREHLLNNAFAVQVRFRRPWGDIRSEIEASAYLQDFSKNRIQFENNLSIRIFKGLAVNFSSNLQIIRDQLSLPAGEASVEDLLLQRREVATDFEFNGGIGLSYTFGSAFNNVLNTRL